MSWYVTVKIMILTARIGGFIQKALVLIPCLLEYLKMMHGQINLHLMQESNVVVHTQIHLYNWYQVLLETLVLFPSQQYFYTDAYSPVMVCSS